MKRNGASRARLRYTTAAGAVVLSYAGVTSTAYGQTAYFSMQGSFGAIGDKHDFNINLSRSVSNAETLKFQTFARNGGTNAASDTITGDISGIDSVLELFDGVNASRGRNDDQVTTTILDSLVTWTQATGTPLNPNPLVAGNYRLNQSSFLNAGTGPWAVDLVGPANAMSFTGATPTGASTISSLKFGTIGAGANVAAFNSASNLTITGVLAIAQDGNATLTQTGGTITVGGVTTIKTGGTYNLNGGTFNANGNIVLNAGKLISSALGFNLGASKTLTASTGAQVSFGASHTINNGTSFTIQSGSSLSTSSYMDVGATTNGTLTVTGPSTALNVATGITVSSADWGYNGGVANVTISNQATATLNTPALNIGSSTTAGSAGTVNVNTAATMSVKNLSIGNQSAGIGTLTVNGASSAVTQSGSSTLTVGGSYIPGATGTGTLNVQNGGVFTSGTGAISVQTTGTINVAGGTFNANGDVILTDGGTLAQSSGTLNFASGKNLTATNGAELAVTGYSINNGGTWTIQSGSHATATGGLNAGLGGGSGTLVVTGLDTRFTENAGSIASFGSGGTGNFTTSALADVNFNGGFVLCDSTSPSSLANFNVMTGAEVTVPDTNGGPGIDDIRIGTNTAGNATLTVNGSESGINSSLTMTGPSTIAIGSSGVSASVGTLKVESSGVFTTGTGAIKVNKTGKIDIAGGTFNANGDITLDGGKLLRDNTGNFSLAAGKDLTASNGAQVGFTGNYMLNSGSTFTIQSGSSLTSTSSFDIGTNGSNDTLLVTGLNSSFATSTGGANNSNWGLNGSTVNVTVADQATATFNTNVLIADSNSPGTNVTVNVTSAAQVTAKTLMIGTGTVSTGVVTVTGTNSKITQTGTSTLTVGGFGAGTVLGTLNIQSGGTFLTGTGLTTITSRGKIDNAGGTFTAAAVQNDGTLNSASTTNTSAITGTGTTTITGGTLTATGGIRQGTLSISGGGKAVVAQSSPFPHGEDAAVSRVSTLTIANNGLPLGPSRVYTGTLDLGNNDMIVNYAVGNGPATLAAVQDMIRSGFNAGHWNRAGVNSSAAAATTLTALGIADNAVLHRTSFDGVNVTDNVVLVRYTYYGDADLSGQTNLDDFTLFLDGYQHAGNTWVHGDFDYSGQTNLDDFTLFLAAYQQQGAPLSVLESMIDGVPMSGAERAAMLAAVEAVPEPGAATAAAAAALLCGLRITARRRRSSSAAQDA